MSHLIFADFSTRVIRSTVRMVNGHRGEHAVGHALEESDGACVNVRILLRRMVGAIAEALVLAWRAKIAMSNHVPVRRQLI